MNDAIYGNAGGGSVVTHPCRDSGANPGRGELIGSGGAQADLRPRMRNGGDDGLPSLPRACPQTGLTRRRTELMRRTSADAPTAARPRRTPPTPARTGHATERRCCAGSWCRETTATPAARRACRLAPANRPRSATRRRAAPRPTRGLMTAGDPMNPLSGDQHVGADEDHDRQQHDQCARRVLRCLGGLRGWQRRASRPVMPEARRRAGGAR